MNYEDNYDKNILSYMLNMRNRVLNDECSVESASRVIGNKFFNKYVSPVVDDLDKNKAKKEDGENDKNTLIQQGDHLDVLKNLSKTLSTLSSDFVNLVSSQLIE